MIFIESNYTGMRQGEKQRLSNVTDHEILMKSDILFDVTAVSIGNTFIQAFLSDKNSEKFVKKFY